MTHASTPARLRAAAEAGTLEADDARLLEEAHELIAGLRLAHQVEQLRAGVEPDDFLDPGAAEPAHAQLAQGGVPGRGRRPAADRLGPAPRRPVRSPSAAAYRAARLPARRTPWREAAFCVVDVEATGLDPRRDAIIAWSAVPVDGGRVVLAGAREGLVRPPGEVPAESIRIHGLRELDLAGAPAPEQAADALLEAMSGRVLVAHAAWVERAFLGRLLRARGARLRGPVVDTSVLGPAVALRARRPGAGHAVARRAGDGARAAGPPPAPGDGRRPHHGAGVHRARRPARRRDGTVAGRRGASARGAPAMGAATHR